MAPGAPAAAVATGALQELGARLDALARRVDELAAAASPVQPTAEAAAVEPPARTRGRPRGKAVAKRAAGPRVGLHDEIAAVIEERGPQTAAELAAAVIERGRYAPPRSTRPIDASIVNSRVSNPVYRDRFVRRDGRIGLAERS
jgi:hypothetical protein